MATPETAIQQTAHGPKERTITGSLEPVEGRCGAKLRTKVWWPVGTVRYCCLPPKAGKTRCRFHGGSAVSGVDHYNFKDGAHSKYTLLPKHLAEKMRTARTDPERLELTEHIDLLNARLNELMVNATRAGMAYGRLDESGAPTKTPAWLELREQWELLLGANQGSPQERIARARLGALINGGATEDQTWRQWTELTEILRRLNETQTRRDERLGQFIPVEKVQLLGRQMIASVIRWVDDPKALAAIQNDLRQLLGVSAEVGAGRALLSASA